MHFAIYQKLTQHCKLTMLQLKKKKKKQSMAWPDWLWSQNTICSWWVFGWLIWPPYVYLPCVHQGYWYHPSNELGEPNETSYTIYLAQRVAQTTWAPSSSPNASWLAGHIKQKRKLCSPFSRQLVTQTSQAFTNNVDLFLPQLMCL